MNRVEEGESYVLKACAIEWPSINYGTPSFYSDMQRASTHLLAWSMTSRSENAVRLPTSPLVAPI